MNCDVEVAVTASNVGAGPLTGGRSLISKAGTEEESAVCSIIKSIIKNAMGEAKTLTLTPALTCDVEVAGPASNNREGPPTGGRSLISKVGTEVETAVCSITKSILITQWAKLKHSH